MEGNVKAPLGNLTWFHPPMRSHKVNFQLCSWGHYITGLTSVSRQFSPRRALLSLWPLKWRGSFSAPEPLIPPQPNLSFSREEGQALYGWLAITRKGRKRVDILRFAQSVFEVFLRTRRSRRTLRRSSSTWSWKVTKFWQRQRWNNADISRPPPRGQTAERTDTLTVTVLTDSNGIKVPERSA